VHDQRRSSVQARLAKAFRVRGPRVRRIYHHARRIERYFRDAERRVVGRCLPSTAIDIAPARGFLVLPPGSFPESDGIIAEARDALARFDAAAPPEGKNRKRFLQNVVDASTFSLDSAVLRFGLRDDVLAAIARYLGAVPFLTSIQMFHSDAVKDVPTSSQLYHCDGDDVTQIKVFVYCSDVDHASGPLTVLDARTTGIVQRRTGYWYRQRLTDAQVAEAAGSGGEHQILGPAGTTAFVDTSRCFHFGSRVAPEAPARLVTMIQYQTPYSFMLPTSGQHALPFRRLLAPGLGRLQRQVLGE
jgi:hypothetical protein